MSDVSVCPRCESTNTVCLGGSMCPGDRMGRVENFEAEEYICLECKLFYKQLRNDELLWGKQGKQGRGESHK